MSRDKIWHLYARKLMGEASREEILELDHLIEEDASISFELEELKQYWNTEQQPDAEYMEATYLLHRNRMAERGLHPGAQEESVAKKEPFYLKYKAGILTVTALSLAVILILVFNRTVNSEAQATAGYQVKKKEIATEKGSKTFFKLPDGSSVWLNAGSKLTYENMMGNVLREVYLTGEGFFDVVKDAKRAFIIHTQSVDIKVHGTQFNVKAYPGEKTVETSLIHGSVEVLVKNRPGESYLLKPNQKLVLSLAPPPVKVQNDPAAIARVEPVVTLKKLTYQPGDTTAVETSWVRNRLVFEDESFSEVALKMERWFDVEFEFRKKKLESEHLRGSFEDESLEQALKALQFISSTKFNYKIENRKVILY